MNAFSNRLDFYKSVAAPLAYSAATEDQFHGGGASRTCVFSPYRAFAFKLAGGAATLQWRLISAAFAAMMLMRLNQF